MDNVIFHLIEPCENTFNFSVIDCSNLQFNYEGVCEVSIICEDVCEPYVIVNTPTLCSNLIFVEELDLCPELVFNWTCRIGEDYLYLVTSTSHFFDTSDNKHFVLKKI